MAVVFDAVSAAHQAISDGDTTRAGSMLATVQELSGALGLDLAAAGTGGDDEIDALVAQRDASRADRDFATADAIRDELAARGVVLEDTPNGTIWHRA
jgi:cysteinyl-tRNA synthetase